MFYIAAVIYLIGMITFVIFGSGERQPWADEYEQVSTDVDGTDIGDRILIEK